VSRGDTRRHREGGERGRREGERVSEHTAHSTTTAYSNDTAYNIQHTKYNESTTASSSSSSSSSSSAAAPHLH
jgi:beta-glucanase (GH16 family)